MNFINSNCGFIEDTGEHATDAGKETWLEASRSATKSLFQVPQHAVNYCKLPKCWDIAWGNNRDAYCYQHGTTRDQSNKCPTGGCTNLSEDGILNELCHVGCKPNRDDGQGTEYYQTGTPNPSRSTSRTTRSRDESFHLDERTERTNKTARKDEGSAADVDRDIAAAFSRAQIDKELEAVKNEAQKDMQRIRII